MTTNTVTTTDAAADMLAGRPNTSILAAASISSAVAGPIAMKPNSMGELMEFAKLMAMSRGSIPSCLRGNPADCLAVAMDAYSAGLSPFALAKDAYKVGDIIAYGAKSTIAMLYALAPLDGRLHLEWEGEGEKLVCTVTGKLRGDPRPKVLQVELKTITVRNSPMWKQQPKVQLGYWAQRAWARLYCPEATLGATCIDDVEAEQQMRDVTPPGERPRTAAGQLSAFAAAPALEHDAGSAPETFVPPPQVYPLVTLDGEVSETTSAADWLARFEAALQAAADPARLWEMNSDAAEWAADMTEGGDDTMARLRKAYLTRQEGGQPEGDADAPAGDEWADELAELQRIGSSCQTVGQWRAFAADYAARIDALTASGGTQAEAWGAFAQGLVDSFQTKKAAK
ncbi:hypothetical protein [Azospirillum argentinense]|uniref:recombinase RecT n=1 Tax=Azospirillum argentinense TaxID=2970906 RepID=UPI0032E01B9E